MGKVMMTRMVGPTIRRRLVWYGLSALAVGLYIVGWNQAPVIPVFPLCPWTGRDVRILDELDPRYLAAFKRSLIVEVRRNGGRWLDLPGRRLLVSRSYYTSDFMGKDAYNATIDAAEELVGYRLNSGRTSTVMYLYPNACDQLRAIARGEIPSRHELRWWE